MPRTVTRAKGYLDAIRGAGGEASRMALLKVASNNVDNLDRMITKLKKWGWIEETERNGKKTYRMTPRGEYWHRALDSQGDLDPLIEELSRPRLMPENPQPQFSPAAAGQGGRFVVFEDLQRATGPKVHSTLCAFYQNWLIRPTTTTRWYGPLETLAEANVLCAQIAKRTALLPSVHDCVAP